MAIKEGVAEQIKEDQAFRAQVGDTLDESQLEEISAEIEKLEGQESVGEGEIFRPREK